MTCPSRFARRARVSFDAALVASVGLALGGWVFSACGRSKKAQDVQTVEPVVLKEKTKPAITVFNQHGGVRLQGARGLPPRIGGRVERSAWGGSVGEARKVLSGIKVLVARDKTQVRYVVDRPSGKSAHFTADLVLEVPVESDVRVVTSRGKVQVDGVRGRVDVESGQGDVLIRAADGPVRVTNRKGTVRVSGLLKTLEIENGKGDVFVRLKGPDRLDDDSVIRTQKGSVSVKLVSTLNARLNVEAPADRVRSAFSLKRVDPSLAQTVLGNGGRLLVVAAKGGDVRIIRLPFVKTGKMKIKGLPFIRGGHSHEHPPSPKMPRNIPVRPRVKPPLKTHNGLRPGGRPGSLDRARTGVRAGSRPSGGSSRPVSRPPPAGHR